MKKIVVVGGGTMGLDIAHTFARSGHAVVVREISDELAEKSHSRLVAALDKLVARGKMDEAKKADILAQLEGKKPLIQRSKGLGENEPDMMWLTTMNPETRRLIKVMPEDVERTAQVFDLLLGDDLQGRKSHIADNGYKYLELADIS
mgnify:CR=1 FL=1